MSTDSLVQIIARSNGMTGSSVVVGTYDNLYEVSHQIVTNFFPKSNVTLTVSFDGHELTDSFSIESSQTAFSVALRIIQLAKTINRQPGSVPISDFVEMHIKQSQRVLVVQVLRAERNRTYYVPIGGESYKRICKYLLKDWYFSAVNIDPDVDASIHMWNAPKILIANSLSRALLDHNDRRHYRPLMSKRIVAKALSNILKGMQEYMKDIYSYEYFFDEVVKWAFIDGHMSLLDSIGVQRWHPIIRRQIEYYSQFDKEDYNGQS